MSFERLVRFVDAQGVTSYGNLKSEPKSDLFGAEVEVLEGDLEKGFHPTGRTTQIQKVGTYNLFTFGIGMPFISGR